MIKGVLSNDLATPDDVCVGEILADRRSSLEESYGVRTSADNRDVLRTSEITVIALKPQHIPSTLEALAGSVPQDSLILSIAAGTRIQTLHSLLKHDAIVRVMPNTPAQVGQGMSVWTATREVSQSQREATATILQALGKEIHVDEERYLDMATAISGSGPGYVLLFLEALIDAGVHIGLSRPQAEAMARQTLLGTALLAEESEHHPAELRNMVTSPGGTTAEAILVLEEAGLRGALTNAVIAAYERSKELG